MGVRLFIRYPNTGELVVDLPTSNKKQISEKIRRVLRSEDKYLAIDVEDDDIEYILGTELLQNSFITIIDKSEDKKDKSPKSSGKLVVLDNFTDSKKESVEKTND